MTTHELHDQAWSDRTAVQELIDEHLPFDCNVIEIAPRTWAIHGPVPYAGESILAEFGSRADAEAALAVLAAAERSNASASGREGS